MLALSKSYTEPFRLVSLDLFLPTREESMLCKECFCKRKKNNKEPFLLLHGKISLCSHSQSYLHSTTMIMLAFGGLHTSLCLNSHNLSPRVAKELCKQVVNPAQHSKCEYFKEAFLFFIRLTYANSWVSYILDRVFVVERFAYLTVASHGVVLTVITHSSADISRSQIHRHVKVTGCRVAVTVTLWRKNRFLSC